MFIETHQRHKPVLFHRKAFSNCLEETEYNHRNYVVLLSHFSDNLNASIKKFQECIKDLDEHPKFKISKSEKQVLDYRLEQLCQQNIEKLCKESFYRNALIRKGYNSFFQNYFSKHKKSECSKLKTFTVKSYSQKQKINQRLSTNKQSSSKPNNSIYQKKQIRRPIFLSKPMLYQLDLTTRLQKLNFQGSKLLSVKKAGLNQCRQISNSTTTERKTSNSDIKGSFVFVSQSNLKEEQEWQQQKKNKNPAHSLSNNKVTKIWSRMSTNPQQYEKQKGLKNNRTLRMSYINIQGSSVRNKVKPITCQQQIKMILNIDN